MSNGRMRSCPIPISGASTTRGSAHHPEEVPAGHARGPAEEPKRRTRRLPWTSPILCKLAVLSGDRSDGSTGGVFQLRGEEVALFSKLLGVDLSHLDASGEGHKPPL